MEIAGLDEVEESLKAWKKKKVTKQKKDKDEDKERLD
jgi:hypothetical protein